MGFLPSYVQSSAGLDPKWVLESWRNHKDGTSRIKRGPSLLRHGWGKFLSLFAATRDARIRGDFQVLVPMWGVRGVFAPGGMLFSSQTPTTLQLLAEGLDTLLEDVGVL